MHDQKNILIVIATSAITAIIVVALTVGLVFSNKTQVALYLLGSNQGTMVASHSEGADTSVVQAVEKTNPAVVSIIITKDVPVFERSNNRSRSPFFDLFGDIFDTPEYTQNGTEERQVGGGSGFFVAPDGLIVTNQHVVNDEDAAYTVYTNDGKKHPAKVVAKDPVEDIAFIKIEPEFAKDYPYLTFASSKDIQLGQTVIAIGNALGEFRNTVSVGVVSGLSRSLIAGNGAGVSEELNEVIQTDAAINPGNSGGPLLDLAGNVIGVNVAVAIGSQNIGFALPADSVKTAVDSVRTRGIVSRPYMGIRYGTVENGVEVSGGRASESGVVKDSPAERAGIKDGDIILEIEGTKITADKSVSSIIRNKKPGDTISLKILRSGQERIITLVLGEFPQTQ
ncbi:MAG: trypsin-like peptidase domain-containing protein [Patescibacteria group bacterium]